MRVTVGPGSFELSGPAVERASNALRQRLGDYLCLQVGQPSRRVEIGCAYEPIFPWEQARWITTKGQFALEFTVFSAKGALENDSAIKALILDHDEPEELLVDRIVGLIRSLCTELWREKGMLAFHGAAVELINGQGFIVLGPSGTGKSTFATGPWVRHRRSDDHALLQTEEGYQMPGVPFSGREGHPTLPGSTPISGFIFPRWVPGARPEIHKLPRAQAIELLLANLLCIDVRSETFETNFKYIEELVSLFPVLELRYDATQTDASLATLLASEIQIMKKAS
jgi:hypothetical protein